MANVVVEKQDLVNAADFSAKGVSDLTTLQTTFANTSKRDLSISNS